MDSFHIALVLERLEMVTFPYNLMLREAGFNL